MTDWTKTPRLHTERWKESDEMKDRQENRLSQTSEHRQTDRQVGRHWDKMVRRYNRQT